MTPIPPEVTSRPPPAVVSKPPPAVVSKPPPAVASKPPAARAARLTPRPPGVTPKPAAAQPTAKAKAAPSRARKKGERNSRDRLDSHAEGFFAEGEAGLPPVHEDVLPPSIFSPERRPALLKYLGLALALVVVIGAFVFMRGESTPQGPAATALPPETTAVQPSIPPIPPIPAPSAVASNAAPPAGSPPAAASASAATVGAASAIGAASSATPAPSAAAAAAPDAPTKTAAEEKADAQKALDRGKTKDAIEAATRSTALDPTDGDAWLLLGAANMELGKTGDARAAFSACSKQATRGQIAECRSMLR